MGFHSRACLLAGFHGDGHLHCSGPSFMALPQVLGHQWRLGQKNRGWTRPAPCSSGAPQPHWCQTPIESQESWKDN